MIMTCMRITLRHGITTIEPSVVSNAFGWLTKRGARLPVAA
jgi:hypothetical protein